MQKSWVYPLQFQWQTYKLIGAESLRM